MTATRLLIISFAALVLNTAGLFALVILSLKYFTYQGTGLDWIYPVSGLLIMAWLLSAFGVVANGVTVIATAIKRRTAKQR
jgi:hypothetical protein